MDIHSPDIHTTLGPTADLDRLGDEIAELSAHIEAATARLLDPRKVAAMELMYARWPGSNSSASGPPPRPPLAASRAARSHPCRWWWAAVSPRSRDCRDTSAPRTRSRRNTARTRCHHVRRLEQLGYQVLLVEPAA